MVHNHIGHFLQVHGTWIWGRDRQAGSTCSRGLAMFTEGHNQYMLTFHSDQNTREPHAAPPGEGQQLTD